MCRGRTGAKLIGTPHTAHVLLTLLAHQTEIVYPSPL
jgi:hypothetical protein